MEKNKKIKVLIITLLFISTLALPATTDLLAQKYPLEDAPENDLQTIGDLNVGDLVVDNSWEWHYRLGYNYTILENHPGETKPVEWIVVAKNHYSGLAPHVTLLSKDLIGMHMFDNSRDRGDNYGVAHWGDSGTTTAQYGIRPFLNSFPKEAGYSYVGNGFYDVIPQSLRNCLLTANIPCKTYTGASYTTRDRVFALSQTELGGGNDASYFIGRVMEYFDIADEEEQKNLRIAEVPGYSEAYIGGSDEQVFYWTRSARAEDIYYSRMVNRVGTFNHYVPESAYGGVRPAINVHSDMPVSMETNVSGYYEMYPTDLCLETRIGDVNMDGLITVADAIMILRHVVGLSILTEEEMQFADINEDDFVNVADAIQILRKIVGLA